MRTTGEERTVLAVEGRSPVTESIMSAIAEGRSAATSSGAETKQNLGVARTRKHTSQALIRVLQLITFIVLIGGWELAVHTRFADPFFFSQPSHIAARAWTW